MSEGGDRLIRLLGADPATYRPVARAQMLILDRRDRLARQRAGWLSRRITPFQFLCFMAFVSGIAVSSVALTLAPALLGAAAVYTFGAVFLLLTVILDDFDVLVNPAEYLVLAAHPHDGWSVLLAKIVAVGRSIAFLGACYFLPGALITMVVLRSPLAGLAFLFGAALVTVAVGSSGMLFAAALVSLWGRRVLDRILPLVQVLYVGSILVPTLGKQALRHAGLPALAKTGALQWIIPSAWFVWPLELAMRSTSGATWIRAALASGSLVATAAIGARWIGGRFGERLLDPPAAPRRRRGVQTHAAGRRIHLVGRSPETRAVLQLISAHLRSDFMFRSHCIGTTFTPLVLLPSIYFSRNVHGFGGKPEFVMGILGFGLTTLLGSFSRILTQSGHPEALWCVLTSPVGRMRFALSSISAIRGVVVVPYLVLMGVIAVLIRAGTPVSIALLLLGMAILAEAFLYFWRGFYRAVPFSLPIRSAGRMGGMQVVAMLGGMIMCAGAVTALLVAQHYGPWVQAAVTGIFLAALGLASLWARRRVSQEAEAMELGGEAQVVPI